VELCVLCQRKGLYHHEEFYNSAELYCFFVSSSASQGNCEFEEREIKKPIVVMQ